MQASGIRAEAARATSRLCRAAVTSRRAGAPRRRRIERRRASASAATVAARSAVRAATSAASQATRPATPGAAHARRDARRDGRPRDQGHRVSERPRAPTLPHPTSPHSAPTSVCALLTPPLDPGC
ncbi:Protein of unknown function [Gryllus bimaculatus]|nr:Protein of unknown function [Gryllus bimaculatus]